VHRLECECGELSGEVDVTASCNRGICYCTDCQAFAYFLGAAERVLDARGGTDIVQTSPQAVRLIRGRQHVACVRLTSDGLMRWYAACCNTPIGNTPPNYRLSFVGLIHCCLSDLERSLDASFGPSRMRVHTGSAWDEPKPRGRGVVCAVVRLGSMMLRARLSGAYRDTPFFGPDGVPMVAPKVLSAEEHAAVMGLVARH
jgi:hypothetical protein